jgi:ABC-2 type transport system ATP-binding protein
MLDVNNLVVIYADGTKAVDGISFSVGEGEFFGFLGPNGAGKSTTIKVVTTLLKKTEGSVAVAGHNIDHDPQAIRRLIGVEAQEMVIDPDLTARENLILQGNLQQMKGAALEERADELLKLVELSHVADKAAGRFSGGMKKRLQLAASLVHKPKLLFLDEPTTGLDPQSRAGIWDYLEKLNDEGVTIFLTTQYLEEADRLCERLAIIDHGKIVASGSPKELKRDVGADTITLSFEGGDRDARLRDTAKRVLMGVPGIVEVMDSDGGLTAHAKNAGVVIADVVRALDENQIRLSSVSFSSPTLDDVFLQHTGRRIRVEELGKMPDRAIFRRR